MSSLLSKAKDLREKFAPVRVNSAFKEKGVLTPEEFVLAGDQLVFKCPTWSWESGKPSQQKPYLPNEKQFLVTKGVPCMNRINNVENKIEDFEIDGIEGDGEVFSDWVETRFQGVSNRESNVAIELGDEDASLKKGSVDDAFISTISTIQLNDEHFAENSKAENDKKSDSSYPDINLYDDNVVVDSDQATLATYMVAEEPIDSIIKTRIYDVSITYDKYYQVPRIWLVGYNEDGMPLNPDEVFEDIMQDYAKKTVTIEAHPHNGERAASIHPCRHAEVMKSIIEGLSQTEISSPRVDQYMFVFLKFIQSVVPTIEYDFTMEVGGAP
mmetsp:Transcript_14183/g.20962  ORF Transcript_14183/g.20962 Transcript_14183/m.20962 type:complete len:326 (-) Transcript_14183:111-1088(-)|eukprot:CAMPEP_0171453204 /NCGR_PEP_ID=MMETSP0945-20130129/1010_1 /TAXON_ID=109269 /ORGANISM="Vaucheria litorea, Strain CCMP2940" /LENGTH=325 /DNA_ID=CAMNT_0011978033 /DNA_START=33 /DNA_END=1010 /DNA_ORIENTATION=+